MSDTNLIYSSSPNLPFGSVLVNINSVTYRTQGWTPKSNNREIWRTDTLGDKADLEVRREPRTVSTTLQLANNATVLPPEGATFVDPISNANPNWIITKVSPAYAQGAFWVVDIDCTQPPVAPSSGT